MAEEPPLPRYHCHTCNFRFEIPAVGFSCPQCWTSFIEDTHPEPQPSPLPEPVATTSTEPANNVNTIPPGGFYIVRWTREPIQPVQNGQESGETTPQLENLISEFFRGIGVIFTEDNGTTVQVIIGNPSDYVEGREEFDAIVTQLLDQVEDNGTPPLPKEILEAIPAIKLTAEHLIKEPICPVCREDFAIDESVRQLDCNHLFHDQCIQLWLDLHSTCPLCRHYLGNDPEYVNEGSRDEGNNLTTLQQIFNVAQRSRSGSATSGSTVGGPSDSEPSSSATTSTNQPQNETLNEEKETE